MNADLLCDIITVAILGLGAVIVSIMLFVESRSNAGKKIGHDWETWKRDFDGLPEWKNDDVISGGC